MSQSDGMGGKLKRIALQFGNDTWYRFKVNPANYSEARGQRTTVFKTKSDIIVEDYGADLPVITFTGSTGFKKDSKGHSGADRLKNMKKFVKEYADSGGNGNRSAVELTFHNFTDDESYIVHLAPEAFKIERNVEQPLLYTYTLTFVVLRSAEVPPDREVVDPNIGNETPSVGGGGVGTTDRPNNPVITPPATTPTEQTTRDVISGLRMGGAINPRGTANAYEYGLKELERLIGYGEG